jgi:hypothetical protein
MWSAVRIGIASLFDLGSAVARLPGDGKRGMERLLGAVNRLYARCEDAGLLARPPTFDTSYRDYPALRGLESSYAVIRTECETLLRERDRLLDVERLGGQYTAGGHRRIAWTCFVLRARVPVPSNCASCPGTAAALSRVPGVHNAFFSVLGAHQHIAPHWGYYKGFVRYHLGVVIPDDNADLRSWLRVNADPRDNALRDPRLIQLGIKHYWRNGRGVVFDDTHLHEARNDADQERVVLFLDVDRKLPRPLAWFHRAVLWIAGRLVPEWRDMARVAASGAPAV